MLFRTLRFVFGPAALIGILLLTGLVPVEPALSQQPAEPGESAETADAAETVAAERELVLRDGRLIMVRDIRIQRTGIACTFDGGRLRLSWGTLAPRMAYELRRRHLDETQAPPHERVELAIWCARQPELLRETVDLLEAVLQTHPEYARAEERLEGLGYVFRNGLAWRLADWERHRGSRETPPERNSAGGNGGETIDPSPRQRPVRPSPAQRPGEPIRVAVELVERIDWADHVSTDVNPSRSAQAMFVEYLTDRRFVVTDDQPHYRIVGRVDVTCIKHLQFFEVTLSAGFTGRASVTVTRTADGEEIPVPTVAYELERSSVQPAVDGMLQNLAARLGASTAARLR